MYNKLVAELVMGRVVYGPSLYGPSWLWAEFVMGRVCHGPRCPVTKKSMAHRGDLCMFFAKRLPL